MEKNMQKLLITAVVTGILTSVSLKSRADDDKTATANPDESKYECQGGNSCKGKGACGGPGHSCAGKNACKGKGYVNTKDKAECDALLEKMKKMKGKKS